MFYSLKGKILKVDENSIAIETAGGEGYSVHMPQGAISKAVIGEEVRVITRLFVRDDALEIFGFFNEREKELFDLLNTVSGVGPRAAMTILDLGSAEDIRAGIATGKVEMLTKSFGIGKKTAERIIVELRDKVKSTSEAISNWDDDVYEALLKLGYRREDAKEAMKKIDPEIKTTNEKLKDAIRKMK
ncbi:MAG: Holliday junction branch migration protein RuvA [Candidatus Colwellbacteria bacterium]|nr:Holliday junction branch migration protein RuvA [Candidatus Colwellbacteria bacterium]